MTDAPDGFALHDRRSGVTDPWQPIFARETEQAVILGLRAGAPHTNSRGLVHGGLLAALADNAMGLSCAKVISGRHDSAERLSLLTLSLTIDFLSSARPSQWLAFHTEFVRIGATICFTQAFVYADDIVCARANASFKVISVPRSPRPAAS